MRNWAGNITFSAPSVVAPSTLDELRAIVTAPGPLRAIGTGHSFTPIADTAGTLICLANLPATISLHESSVTVPAGRRYGDLAVELHQAGRAVPNLASLPHLSVTGAIATGTHGSGDANRSLSASVAGLDLLTASGDLLTYTRAHPDFAGIVIGLGALGIITAVTLDTVPTFEIAQTVYENVPLTDADALLASGYSASLFTDWTTTRLWVKHRTSDPLHPLDFTPAAGPTHPIAQMPAGNCTEQQGVPGPWHERLPHFRLDFTPSAGDELQTEYLVPRHLAAEALATLRDVAALFRDALQISEIRSVAADNLWLSPAYLRDSVAIHFTWISDERRVHAAITAVEHHLAPFHPRPHWAKLFHTNPIGLYDRARDFVALRERLDPGRRFANPYVDGLFA